MDKDKRIALTTEHPQLKCLRCTNLDRETMKCKVKGNLLTCGRDFSPPGGLGEKVIFYVENMKPGQQIAFDFQVKALYPVKAKGVTSTAFSYYRPDIKGETLGVAVTVH